MQIPKKYYIWLGVGLLLLIVNEFTKKQNIDWRPTYSTYDNIPYGTQINYLMAKNGQWKDKIERSNKLFNELFDQDSSNYSLIYMANTIAFTEQAGNNLLQHIANGNTVLMAANKFPNFIFNDFNVAIEYTSGPGKGNLSLYDNFYFSDTLQKELPIEVQPYFSWKSKSDNIATIGKRDNHSNFICIKHGSGKLYLHCNPIVFTNYLFIHQVNTKYVNDIFSLLPNEKLIWDDYMNYGNRKPQSELRYILSSPSIKLAYYIMSVLLLIFITLAWRRQQRMILVIEPYNNSSLDFIETLKNFFISNKNNGIIAAYLIQNFKVKMSRRYFINWKENKGKTKKQLMQISGQTTNEIEVLMHTLNKDFNNKKITQSELIEINKQIEKFETPNESH